MKLPCSAWTDSLQTVVTSKRASQMENGLLGPILVTTLQQWGQLTQWTNELRRTGSYYTADTYSATQ